VPPKKIKNKVYSPLKKKIRELIHSLPSNCNGMVLKTSNKKVTGKYQGT
jgi:hypothetical protein